MYVLKARSSAEGRAFGLCGGTGRLVPPHTPRPSPALRGLLLDLVTGGGLDFAEADELLAPGLLVVPAGAPLVMAAASH
ncbi:hypothetical protein GCM10017771_05040 [Streptomyces capitiformicae]|uniref:Uncharacterized protein n=1 Tax=Streptomyces capitiformicae TaxID=2014920 RepID=A0A919GCF3_9ACTN|nr:hypothetical protein GCM10017771_05040 [Streptomyces capitiformicae]